MISAGEMQRRITIRSVTRVDDEYGGHTEQAVDVATVWAKVEPLEGNEQLRAMQAGMTRPHRFTIRYRTGITGATEVLYDSRRFNVTSVIDVDAGHREIAILADEAVV